MEAIVKGCFSTLHVNSLEWLGKTRGSTEKFSNIILIFIVTMTYIHDEARRNITIFIRHWQVHIKQEWETKTSLFKKLAFWHFYLITA